MYHITCQCVTASIESSVHIKECVSVSARSSGNNVTTGTHALATATTDNACMHATDTYIVFHLCVSVCVYGNFHISKRNHKIKMFMKMWNERDGSGAGDRYSVAVLSLCIAPAKAWTEEKRQQTHECQPQNRLCKPHKNTECTLGSSAHVHVLKCAVLCYAVPVKHTKVVPEKFIIVSSSWSENIMWEMAVAMAATLVVYTKRWMH